MTPLIVSAFALLSAFSGVSSRVLPYGGHDAHENTRRGNSTCQRTQVAILGAGIAGIIAAQALANQSIDDFLIIELQGEIGGRVHHATFGQGPDGTPLLIEYGANWAQGLGTPGHSENPIWTLEKKWGIANTQSNFSRIITYNESGAVDFASEIDEFDEALRLLAEEGGEILSGNLQDRTIREGLSLVGWKPQQRAYPAAADAVEWWLYDGEQAVTPDETSLVFNTAVSNFTFLQFSNENNFIVDQRGHNTWIKGEASEFMAPNDRRLLLDTTVTDIWYSASGVEITTSDGDCIQADYAICTFSVGVLQHESAVTFEPSLPSWKRTAIEMFEMGTYTKIFMQFPSRFWPDDTEFFLYADPIQRGWYPIWQSLDLEGFFPDSHVIFVTVTERESHRVEKMTEAETQAEVMAVLRSMFPDVDVPDPIAFTYPRWTQTPWAYGSFSCWPAGTTLEMHQNLRANVDRLWFAGEGTSASYFGYMQGAWFEGRDIGNRIAGLIKGNCIGDAPTGGGVKGNGDCGEMVRYINLHGTTDVDEYNIQNGWDGTSFQTNGLDPE
ncbi:putative flavin-containing polyamine oxidase [Xylariales sp. AK1849]|nr:putative flavin-containing polyamine oxidase [Xylariales sp. AK1849]